MERMLNTALLKVQTGDVYLEQKIHLEYLGKGTRGLDMIVGRMAIAETSRALYIKVRRA